MTRIYIKYIEEKTLTNKKHEQKTGLRAVICCFVIHIEEPSEELVGYWRWTNGRGEKKKIRNNILFNGGRFDRLIQKSLTSGET